MRPYQSLEMGIGKVEIPTKNKIEILNAIDHITSFTTTSIPLKFNETQKIVLIKLFNTNKKSSGLYDWNTVSSWLFEQFKSKFEGVAKKEDLSALYENFFNIIFDTFFDNLLKNSTIKDAIPHLAKISLEVLELQMNSQRIKKLGSQAVSAVQSMLSTILTDADIDTDSINGYLSGLDTNAELFIEYVLYFFQKIEKMPGYTSDDVSEYKADLMKQIKIGLEKFYFFGGIQAMEFRIDFIDRSLMRLRRFLEPMTESLVSQLSLNTNVLTPKAPKTPTRPEIKRFTTNTPPSVFRRSPSDSPYMTVSSSPSPGSSDNKDSPRVFTNKLIHSNSLSSPRPTKEILERKQSSPDSIKNSVKEIPEEEKEIAQAVFGLRQQFLSHTPQHIALFDKELVNILVRCDRTKKKYLVRALLAVEVQSVLQKTTNQLLVEEIVSHKKNFVDRFKISGPNSLELINELYDKYLIEFRNQLNNKRWWLVRVSHMFQRANSLNQNSPSVVHLFAEKQVNKLITLLSEETSLFEGFKEGQKRKSLEDVTFVSTKKLVEEMRLKFESKFEVNTPNLEIFDKILFEKLQSKPHCYLEAAEEVCGYYAKKHIDTINFYSEENNDPEVKVSDKNGCKAKVLDAEGIKRIWILYKEQGYQIKVFERHLLDKLKKLDLGEAVIKGQLLPVRIEVLIKACEITYNDSSNLHVEVLNKEFIDLTRPDIKMGVPRTLRNELHQLFQRKLSALENETPSDKNQFLKTLLLEWYYQLTQLPCNDADQKIESKELLPLRKTLAECSRDELIECFSLEGFKAFLEKANPTQVYTELYDHKVPGSHTPYNVYVWNNSLYDHTDFKHMAAEVFVQQLPALQYKLGKLILETKTDDFSSTDLYRKHLIVYFNDKTDQTSLKKFLTMFLRENQIQESKDHFYKNIAISQFDLGLSILLGVRSKTFVALLNETDDKKMTFLSSMLNQNTPSNVSVAIFYRITQIFKYSIQITKSERQLLIKNLIDCNYSYDDQTLSELLKSLDVQEMLEFLKSGKEPKIDLLFKFKLSQKTFLDKLTNAHEKHIANYMSLPQNYYEMLCVIGGMKSKNSKEYPIPNKSFLHHLIAKLDCPWQDITPLKKLLDLFVLDVKKNGIKIYQFKDLFDALTDVKENGLTVLDAAYQSHNPYVRICFDNLIAEINKNIGDLLQYELTQLSKLDKPEDQVLTQKNMRENSLKLDIAKLQRLQNAAKENGCKENYQTIYDSPVILLSVLLEFCQKLEQVLVELSNAKTSSNSKYRVILQKEIHKEILVLKELKAGESVATEAVNIKIVTICELINQTLQNWKSKKGLSSTHVTALYKFLKDNRYRVGERLSEFELRLFNGAILKDNQVYSQTSDVKGLDSKAVLAPLTPSAARKSS